MTRMTLSAVLPLLVVIASILASPRATEAQLVSARPASVDLTVVVPPRPHSNVFASSGASASIVGVTSTTIDLETTVDVIDPSASRLEVRLGGAWRADSTAVLVRNSRGEFERLSREATVVAIDAMPRIAGSTNAIRFRVESAAPHRARPPAIPLEYRLTVGRGDEFSVWRFSSLLQITER